MDRTTALQEITFGSRVAEDEGEALRSYFVETDVWRQVFNGDADVVYGPKGAGKSAIYLLLLSRDEELFDRGVLVIPAENPRGATAFRDIAADPPTTEAEFRNLWKLYFLTLVGDLFADWNLHSEDAVRVLDALSAAGLRENNQRLAQVLKSVATYVRRQFAVESFDTGLLHSVVR